MKPSVLELKGINILSLFSNSYKSSKIFTLPNQLQYGLIEQLGYTPCGSIAKLCLTLWDSMGCSMPGFPVFHFLTGFADTHVH